MQVRLLSIVGVRHGKLVLFVRSQVDGLDYSAVIPLPAQYQPRLCECHKSIVQPSLDGLNIPKVGSVISLPEFAELTPVKG